MVHLDHSGPRELVCALGALGPDGPTSSLCRVKSTAEGRLPYFPALDGLRGVALTAILCFHAGFEWIHGGYLPLTTFFVLSGFLITSLLLLEHQRKGEINLIAFWGRRARRLVPAAIVALALVAVYVAAIDEPVEGLRGDVFASLGWVANWRFIFAERSYADLFGDPSPLQHFWSLAVEEQFYLFLPLFAVGTLYLANGKRWLFASVTVVLVAASAVAMAILHVPGEPPLRAYFGTDTRAAELLVGVLLAFLLIGPNGLRRLTGPARVAVNIGGAAALAVTGVLWFVAREFDSRLYEGGLLGISLMAALIVASGTQEGTIVTRLLSFEPFAALGRVSYGVYLFHWPLFLWMDEGRTGLEGGPLFAARMAVTMVLTVASYHLLERPIRNRQWRPQLMLAGWANATVAVAAVLVVVTASTGRTDLLTVRDADDGTPTVIRARTDYEASDGGDGDTSTTGGPASSSSTTNTTGTTARGWTHNGSTSSLPSSSPTTTPGTTGPGGTSPTTVKPATTTTKPPPPPLKLLVVGDSLARNLAGGLEAHQEKHNDMSILSYAFDGCPVVTEGVMFWPGDRSQHTVDGHCGARKAEWAAQIRDFDPDVVFISSSIFDILDRQIAGWAGPLTIGDPTFDSWLKASQRQVVSTLGAGGARVVWGTQPCAQFDPRHANHHENGEGNRRIDLLNVRISQSGATIADLDGKMCPGGGFTSTVAGVSNARSDGVHLSPPAAEALADQWLVPLLLSLRP